MEPRSIRKLLASAVVLGILGHLLLYETLWGINLSLCGVLFMAAIVLQMRDPDQALRADGGWPLVAMLLFAMMLGWRDSFTLRLMNVFAFGVLYSLVVLQVHRASVTQMSVAGHLTHVLRTFADPLYAAAPLLFRGLHWTESREPGAWGRARAVVRGLLIAAPLLLLFGGLFASADAAFNDILDRMLDVLWSELWVRLLISAILAWLAAGALRGLLTERQPLLKRLPPLPRFSLGAVEMSTVLGSLNLLFLGFVLVQLRYLFGGPDVIQTTVGLTYAEYARRGFFELVGVAALVLPLLLIMHALLDRASPRNERIFRTLATVQISLLFVIMASALKRMHLYQGEYGLTELRLYTTAFMGWLAIVFVWFGVTVLTGRDLRFAFGALVAGCAMVVVLNVLNPDALIVRTNLSLAESGRELDARYAVSLSADAIPTLVEALPDLKPAKAAHVASYLDGWKENSQKQDWRAWNLSKHQARNAIVTQMHLRR